MSRALLVASGVAALLGGACSDVSTTVDGSAEGTGGAAGAVDASEGPASDPTGPGQTATSGPGSGDSTALTAGTTHGSSGSSSSDTGRPPFPEECYEPAAVIDIGRADTPDGPLQVDEAWVGVDLCSGPYVALVQLPSMAGPGREVDIAIDAPIDAEGDGGVFFGLYEASVVWDGATGTIQILEPVGPFEAAQPNPDNRLHARIEIHELGWDISAEVELIDCGVDTCFCPCE